ncbi:hypothetical protein [Bacteroides sp.]|uniref:hypothetical protein n=1 Tax=Bacteroides sp. TaxID=29523 RepID=UPI00262FC23F|nr:hypothetical protein [Bacteroides sp.]MDD3039543.1 hypothetical protein [Bacteroides sp.]
MLRQIFAILAVALILCATPASAIRSTVGCNVDYSKSQITACNATAEVYLADDPTVAVVFSIFTPHGPQQIENITLNLNKKAAPDFNVPVRPDGNYSVDLNCSDFKTGVYKGWVTVYDNGHNGQADKEEFTFEVKAGSANVDNNIDFDIRGGTPHAKPGTELQIIQRITNNGSADITLTPTNLTASDITGSPVDTGDWNCSFQTILVPAGGHVDVTFDFVVPYGTPEGALTVLIDYDKV